MPIINMKRTLFFALTGTLLVLLFSLPQISAAAPAFVSSTEGTSVIRNGKIRIFIGEDSPKGVGTAADNLCSDLNAVSGAQAVRVKRMKDASIVIATDGDSSFEELVKEGIISRDDLHGKKEKWILTSRGGKVYIAGSERRGTIYGIYELSRQVGVSPWYYWADVPVGKMSDIRILPGTYTDAQTTADMISTPRSSN